MKRKTLSNELSKTNYTFHVILNMQLSFFHYFMRRERYEMGPQQFEKTQNYIRINESCHFQTRFLLWLNFWLYSTVGLAAVPQKPTK